MSNDVSHELAGWQNPNGIISLIFFICRGKCFYLLDISSAVELIEKFVKIHIVRKIAHKLASTTLIDP